MRGERVVIRHRCAIKNGKILGITNFNYVGVSSRVESDVSEAIDLANLEGLKRSR